MNQLAERTPLAEASRVARAADSERKLSEVRRRLRAPIRAIDLLLDELERINLRGGAPISAPSVAAWLDQVEVAVGAPAPQWVRDVPDTARLHAEVLRWQGAMLDHVRPERTQFHDLREDPLDLWLFPRPLYGQPVEPLRARPGRYVA